MATTYKMLAFMGYPNYRVGDDGTVWSMKTDDWKQLSTKGKNSGYPVVTLSANNKTHVCYVHRLVLTAFFGEQPEGMEGCHNDGNKENNHLTNLRWDTKKNNQRDRNQHGTDNKGEQNGSAKLTWQEVDKIRELYSTGEYTYRQLATIMNVSKAAIQRIVTQINWKTSSS